MNIDELEKLARAADNDVHNIFTNPVFISKATPAAILELIERMREFVRVNDELLQERQAMQDELQYWRDRS